MQDYQTITSPPVYISPLDLGPKYTDKLGAGFQEYRKIYGENYCLGQLIFWHNQSNTEPDCTLARASRGCLSLPDIGSFYAKVQKPSRHRVYGPRTVRSMLARMVSFFVCICEVLMFLTLAVFLRKVTNGKYLSIEGDLVFFIKNLFGDYIILQPSRKWLGSDKG